MAKSKGMDVERALPALKKGGRRTRGRRVSKRDGCKEPTFISRNESSA